MEPGYRGRVYVGGTFDLFHFGHVSLLRRASYYGPVWVSLNTDEFAASYKRRPVLTLSERLLMLSSCVFVDGVVVNRGGADSRPAIEAVCPRYIVHGDDWTGPEYLAQLGVTEEWLAERGIELLYLPYTKSISTSKIIERIEGGLR